MATTETHTFKNYIGGEWVDAAGTETFESTNPATGETIGAFPRSTEGDVARPTPRRTPTSAGGYFPRRSARRSSSASASASSIARTSSPS